MHRRVLARSDKTTLVTKYSNPMNATRNSSNSVNKLKTSLLPIDVIGVSVENVETLSTSVPKTDGGVVGAGQKFIG